MRLLSTSGLANEPIQVFAWWPVPIRSVETHPGLGVKAVKTEWVIFCKVNKRVVYQAGNYRGIVYSRIRKNSENSNSNKDGEAS